MVTIGSVMKSNGDSMKRCSAENRAGKPCRGYAVNGSPFCLFHDPEHAKTRAEAQRRGGINRRVHGVVDDFPDVNLRTADGLLDFMGHLFRETWQLGNSVQRNRTLAALVQVQKQLSGLSEIEARVEAIETLLSERMIDNGK